MRHSSVPFVWALVVLCCARLILAQAPTADPSASGQADPQLSLWRDIKRALTAHDGAAYFASSMESALVPGGAGGVHAFRGTVISSRPAEHPSVLIIGISSATTPEATLRLRDKGLDAAWNSSVPPGAEVEFEGVAAAFAADPFMVTFDVPLATFAVLGEETQAPGPLRPASVIDATPFHLNALASFNLQQALPEELRVSLKAAGEFAVRHDTLCSVITLSSSDAHGPDSQQGVLCTDLAGRRKSWWLLPEAQSTPGLEISESGLYVFQHRRQSNLSTRWLIGYSPEGRLIFERQVAEKIDGIRWTGRALAGIGDWGLIPDLDRQPAAALRPYRRPPSVRFTPLAAGEDAVMLVENQTGAVHKVSLDTGAQTAFRLDVPAVRAAFERSQSPARAATAPMRGSNLTFSPVAGNTAGDLFLAVAPYKAFEGLPVVHVNARGAVRTLRLVLPFAHPAGHARMRADESRIYILDESGAAASYEF